MAEYNVEINKYNQSGNSYDKLYPITKIENVMSKLIVECQSGTSVTISKDSFSFTKVSAEEKSIFDIPEFGVWKIQGGGITESIYINQLKIYTLSLNRPLIYGAQWDGTANTKWSRTDDAISFVNPTPAIDNGFGSSPFDNIMPWAGMKRVSDSQAGELVSIPKFYYKWTAVGNGLKLQIANEKVDGFFVSPAHMDRGDGRGERDIVYVGRYHCSNSNWKSTSGQYPKNNVTRSNARSSIHSLGATIWQWDWHMHMTIWMLYLVEFADWNCQTAIGYGCGNDSSVEVMGKTDGMKYHTGTSQSNRTTYGVGVQYRYIEGLWDNVIDWVDGCYYNSAGLNIINNPAKFSDTTNGTPVGVPIDGFPSKFEVKTVNGFQVIYPIQPNGSDSTYTCDFWHFANSYPCLGVGGYFVHFGEFGLGNVRYYTISDKYSNVGSRLQKLP